MSYKDALYAPAVPVEALQAMSRGDSVSIKHLPMGQIAPSGSKLEEVKDTGIHSQVKAGDWDR